MAEGERKGWKKSQGAERGKDMGWKIQEETQEMGQMQGKDFRRNMGTEG